MSTQHQGLAGGMAGNKPATRPGVIPLSIKEKSALLAAYMPFLENGGLFVPTDKSAQLGDELDWQRERFRVHIRAAREAKKPLIIHTRAAAQDTIRLLREERAEEAGGVMHCFTEDWDIARQALDIGFYISMSGIVSFKNATIVHDVARRVPADRLLIETDSPYLAPVPYRGKTNQPGWVAHVAAAVARLRQIPVEEVGRITTENYDRLFGRARLPAVQPAPTA